MSQNSHNAIDWMCPVNWLHENNRGLAAWYLAIPGLTGGLKWLDITKPSNGHHGTLTNMDPATDWVADAPVGGWASLDFAGDASSNRVNVPTVYGIDGNSFAIECVVYLSSTSLHGGAFVKIGSGTSGIALGYGDTTFDSTGNNLIGLRENVAWVATGQAIGTGWHVVGVTCDGSNARFFIDGVKVSTIAWGSVNTPTTHANLGGYDDNAASRFSTARINSIRITPHFIADSVMAGTYQQSLRSYPDLINWTNRNQRRFVAAGGGGFQPSWAANSTQVIQGGVTL